MGRGRSAQVSRTRNVLLAARLGRNASACCRGRAACCPRLVFSARIPANRAVACDFTLRLFDEGVAEAMVSEMASAGELTAEAMRACSTIIEARGDDWPPGDAAERDRGGGAAPSPSSRRNAAARGGGGPGAGAEGSGAGPARRPPPAVQRVAGLQLASAARQRASLLMRLQNAGLFVPWSPRSSEIRLALGACVRSTLTAYSGVLTVSDPHRTAALVDARATVLERVLLASTSRRRRDTQTEQSHPASGSAAGPRALPHGAAGLLTGDLVGPARQHPFENGAGAASMVDRGLSTAFDVLMALVEESCVESPRLCLRILKRVCDIAAKLPPLALRNGPGAMSSAASRAVLSVTRFILPFLGVVDLGASDGELVASEPRSDGSDTPANADSCSSDSDIAAELPADAFVEAAAKVPVSRAQRDALFGALLSIGVASGSLATLLRGAAALLRRASSSRSSDGDPDTSTPRLSRRSGVERPLRALMEQQSDFPLSAPAQLVPAITSAPRGSFHGYSGWSCVACDGNFLYMHAGGLYKIGTGLGSTTQGEVYASNPAYRTSESGGWLACVGDVLFYRSEAVTAGGFECINTATLLPYECEAATSARGVPSATEASPMLSDGRFLFFITRKVQPVPPTAGDIRRDSDWSSQVENRSASPSVESSEVASSNSGIARRAVDAVPSVRAHPRGAPVSGNDSRPPVPRPAGSRPLLDNGPSDVGRRVRVYWRGESRWFEGTIVSFNRSGRHAGFRIEYDDGDSRRYSVADMDRRIRGGLLELLPRAEGSDAPHERRLSSERGGIEQGIADGAGAASDSDAVQSVDSRSGSSSESDAEKRATVVTVVDPADKYSIVRRFQVPDAAIPTYEASLQAVYTNGQRLVTIMRRTSQSIGLFATILNMRTMSIKRCELPSLSSILCPKATPSEEVSGILSAVSTVYNPKENVVYVVCPPAKHQPISRWRNIGRSPGWHVSPADDVPASPAEPSLVLHTMQVDDVLRERTATSVAVFMLLQIHRLMGGPQVLSEDHSTTGSQAAAVQRGVAAAGDAAEGAHGDDETCVERPFVLELSPTTIKCLLDLLKLLLDMHSNVEGGCGIATTTASGAIVCLRLLSMHVYEMRKLRDIPRSLLLALTPAPALFVDMIRRLEAQRDGQAAMLQSELWGLFAAGFPFFAPAPVDRAEFFLRLLDGDGRGPNRSLLNKSAESFLAGIGARADVAQLLLPVYDARRGDEEAEAKSLQVINALLNRALCGTNVSAPSGSIRRGDVSAKDGAAADMPSAQGAETAAAAAKTKQVESEASAPLLLLLQSLQMAVIRAAGSSMCSRPQGSQTVALDYQSVVALRCLTQGVCRCCAALLTETISRVKAKSTDSERADEESPLRTALTSLSVSPVGTLLPLLMTSLHMLIPQCHLSDVQIFVKALLPLVAEMDVFLDVATEHAGDPRLKLLSGAFSSVTVACATGIRVLVVGQRVDGIESSADTMQWVTSPLFRNALESSSARSSSGGGQNPTSGEFQASTSVSFATTFISMRRTLSDSAPRAKVVDAAAKEEFLADLVDGTGNCDAMAMFEHCKAQGGRFASMGGAVADRVQRAVLAALLKHNGMIAEAVAFSRSVQWSPAISEPLRRIFVRARELRIWLAMPGHADRADDVVNKAKFLLGLRPFWESPRASVALVNAGRRDCERALDLAAVGPLFRATSDPGESGAPRLPRTDSTKSYATEDDDEDEADDSVNRAVLAFVKSPVVLADLELVLSRREARVDQRASGFRSAREVFARRVVSPLVYIHIGKALVDAFDELSNNSTLETPRVASSTAPPGSRSYSVVEGAKLKSSRHFTTNLEACRPDALHILRGEYELCMTELVTAARNLWCAKDVSGPTTAACLEVLRCWTCSIHPEDQQFVIDSGILQLLDEMMRGSGSFPGSESEGDGMDREPASPMTQLQVEAARGVFVHIALSALSSAQLQRTESVRAGPRRSLAPTADLAHRVLSVIDRNIASSVAEFRQLLARRQAVTANVYKADDPAASLSDVDTTTLFGVWDSHTLTMLSLLQVNGVATRATSHTSMAQRVGCLLALLGVGTPRVSRMAAKVLAGAQSRISAAVLNKAAAFASLAAQVLDGALPDVEAFSEPEGGWAASTLGCHYLMELAGKCLMVSDGSVASVPPMLAAFPVECREMLAQLPDERYGAPSAFGQSKERQMSATVAVPGSAPTPSDRGAADTAAGGGGGGGSSTDTASAATVGTTGAATSRFEAGDEILLETRRGKRLARVLRLDDRGLAVIRFSSGAIQRVHPEEILAHCKASTGEQAICASERLRALLAPSGELGATVAELGAEIVLLMRHLLAPGTPCRRALTEGIRSAISNGPAVVARLNSGSSLASLRLNGDLPAVWRVVAGLAVCSMDLSAPRIGMGVLAELSGTSSAATIPHAGVITMADRTTHTVSVLLERDMAVSDAREPSGPFGLRGVLVSTDAVRPLPALADELAPGYVYSLTDSPILLDSALLSNLSWMMNESSAPGDVHLATVEAVLMAQLAEMATRFLRHSVASARDAARLLGSPAGECLLRAASRNAAFMGEATRRQDIYRFTGDSVSRLVESLVAGSAVGKAPQTATVAVGDVGPPSAVYSCKRPVDVIGGFSVTVTLASTPRSTYSSDSLERAVTRLQRAFRSKLDTDHSAESREAEPPTGGSTAAGVAETATPFQIGTHVEVRYRGLLLFYPATISRVHDNGVMYDVAYDDGDYELLVPASFVREARRWRKDLFIAGRRIEGRKHGQMRWQPGSIVEVSGDRCTVRWDDDGATERGVKHELLRINPAEAPVWCHVVGARVHAQSTVTSIKVGEIMRQRGDGTFDVLLHTGEMKHAVPRERIWIIAVPDFSDSSEAAEPVVSTPTTSETPRFGQLAFADALFGAPDSRRAIAAAVLEQEPGSVCVGSADGSVAFLAVSVELPAPDERDECGTLRVIHSTVARAVTERFKLSRGEAERLAPVGGHVVRLDYVPGTLNLSLDGVSVAALQLNIASELGLHSGGAHLSVQAATCPKVPCRLEVTADVVPQSHPPASATSTLKQVVPAVSRGPTEDQHEFIAPELIRAASPVDSATDAEPIVIATRAIWTNGGECGALETRARSGSRESVWELANMDVDDASSYTTAEGASKHVTVALQVLDAEPVRPTSISVTAPLPTSAVSPVSECLLFVATKGLPGDPGAATDRYADMSVDAFDAECRAVRAVHRDDCRSSPDAEGTVRPLGRVALNSDGVLSRGVCHFIADCPAGEFFIVRLLHPHPDTPGTNMSLSFVRIVGVYSSTRPYWDPSVAQPIVDVHISNVPSAASDHLAVPDGFEELLKTRHRRGIRTWSIARSTTASDERGDMSTSELPYELWSGELIKQGSGAKAPPVEVVLRLRRCCVLRSPTHPPFQEGGRSSTAASEALADTRSGPVQLEGTLQLAQSGADGTGSYRIATVAGNQNADGKIELKELQLLCGSRDSVLSQYELRVEDPVTKSTLVGCVITAGTSKTDESPAPRPPELRLIRQKPKPITSLCIVSDTDGIPDGHVAVPLAEGADGGESTTTGRASGTHAPIPVLTRRRTSSDVSHGDDGSEAGDSDETGSSDESGDERGFSVDGWSCRACTFWNSPTLSRCEVCGMQQPDTGAPRLRTVGGHGMPPRPRYSRHSTRRVSPKPKRLFLCVARQPGAPVVDLALLRRARSSSEAVPVGFRSATPTPLSGGRRPRPLPEGTPVEARYRQGFQYADGVILKHHGDGMYDVRFEDVGIELRVPVSSIRVKTGSDTPVSMRQLRPGTLVDVLQGGRPPWRCGVVEATHGETRMVTVRDEDADRQSQVVMLGSVRLRAVDGWPAEVRHIQNHDVTCLDQPAEGVHYHESADELHCWVRRQPCWPWRIAASQPVAVEGPSQHGVATIHVAEAAVTPQLAVALSPFPSLADPFAITRQSGVVYFEAAVSAGGTHEVAAELAVGLVSTEVVMAASKGATALTGSCRMLTGDGSLLQNVPIKHPSAPTATELPAVGDRSTWNVGTEIEVRFGGGSQYKQASIFAIRDDDSLDVKYATGERGYRVERSMCRSPERRPSSTPTASALPATGGAGGSASLSTAGRRGVLPPSPPERRSLGRSIDDEAPVRGAITQVDGGECQADAVPWRKAAAFYPGDTIGCGQVLATGDVFFTRNGAMLGVAVAGVDLAGWKGDLFPAVLLPAGSTAALTWRPCSALAETGLPLDAASMAYDERRALAALSEAGELSSSEAATATDGAGGTGGDPDAIEREAIASVPSLFPSDRESADSAVQAWTGPTAQPHRQKLSDSVTVGAVVAVHSNVGWNGATEELDVVASQAMWQFPLAALAGRSARVTSSDNGRVHRASVFLGDAGAAVCIPFRKASLRHLTDREIAAVAAAPPTACTASSIRKHAGSVCAALRAMSVLNSRAAIAGAIGAGGAGAEIPLKASCFGSASEALVLLRLCFASAFNEASSDGTGIVPLYGAGEGGDDDMLIDATSSGRDRLQVAPCDSSVSTRTSHAAGAQPSSVRALLYSLLRSSDTLVGTGDPVFLHALVNDMLSCFAESGAGATARSLWRRHARSAAAASAAPSTFSTSTASPGRPKSPIRSAVERTAPHTPQRAEGDTNRAASASSHDLLTDSRAATALPEYGFWVLHMLLTFSLGESSRRDDDSPPGIEAQVIASALSQRVVDGLAAFLLQHGRTAAQHAQCVCLLRRVLEGAAVACAASPSTWQPLHFERVERVLSRMERCATAKQLSTAWQRPGLQARVELACAVHALKDAQVTQLRHRVSLRVARHSDSKDVPEEEEKGEPPVADQRLPEWAEATKEATIFDIGMNLFGTQKRLELLYARDPGEVSLLSKVMLLPVVQELAPPVVLKCRHRSRTLEIDDAGYVIASSSFTSVVSADIQIRGGKWYYEVECGSSGLMQIGWALSSFSGHGGSGVGDDTVSWAFDGYRQRTWPSDGRNGQWARWRTGSIVGCAADFDAGVLMFSLDGSFDAPMGKMNVSRVPSLSGSTFVTPAASLSSQQRLKFVFTGSKLRHAPPEGYRPVGELLNGMADPEARDMSTRELAGSAKWTPAMDCDLVRRLNLAAAAAKVVPDQLNLLDVAGRVVEEVQPTAAGVTKEAIAVRLALLRAVNAHYRKALLTTNVRDMGAGPLTAPHVALASLLAGLGLVDASSGATATGESRDDATVVGATAALAAPARLLLRRRALLLSSTKMSVWRLALDATCGPKSAAQQPRVTINRPRAMRAAERRNTRPEDIANTFVGQMEKELRHVKSERLRRSDRAWRVKFAGEGAIDEGGPYLESISAMCCELLSPTLPLFIPAPNNRAKAPEGADLFVPNPAATSTYEIALFELVGRLMGVALRTRTPMGLSLASLVWRRLVADPVVMADLSSADAAFAATVSNVASAVADERSRTLTLDRAGAASPLGSPLSTTLAAADSGDSGGAAAAAGGDAVSTSTADDVVASDAFAGLHFAVPGWDGNEEPLCAGGESRPVTPETAEEFVRLALERRVAAFDVQVAALRRGLEDIVPVHMLALFCAEEVEQLVCGSPVLDVQLLKKWTSYKNGAEPTDNHVRYFWEVMENDLTPQEHVLFLRFVSGRTRLPTSEVELQREYCHLTISTAGALSPSALPTAHLCFFTLELPRYTSREQTLTKLRFAIAHCQAIDTDNVAANREAWA